MKKLFLFFVLILVPQFAQADIILLKDGTVVEGKIVQVRATYIRLQTDYRTPFREFLIENIANIEKSSTDEISQLAVRNIHQRSINKSYNKQLQDAVNKRASSLVEEAIQNSETLSYQRASDEVKAAVQKKASALIEEAVMSVETPPLKDAPEEVKVMAKEKAGGLIEEAVKDVEVSPLQNAPKGIQVAAKKAANILIEGAVMEVRGQGVNWPINIEGVPLSAENAASLLVKEIAKDEKIQNLSNSPTKRDIRIIEPFELSVPNPLAESSGPVLTVKDQVIGGLMILLLGVLLFYKVIRRKESEPTEEEHIKSMLAKEQTWTERRDYPRVKKQFPILLNLDNVLPIFAKVKNMSLSGAYAICEDIKLLRLGDHCQFSLAPSRNNPNFKVDCKAKVVRISSDGLGLQFFDLDRNSIFGLQKVLG